MSNALKTLQFVEPSSIKPDVSIRQVRFAIKADAVEKFDPSTVQEALKKAGYDGSSVMVGPTTS